MHPPVCYPRAMPKIAASTAAILLVSGATMAAQFRAEDFAIPWLSADGSAMLAPANAATNDWTNPALVGGGVSFDTTTNGVPTPLWFGDEATGMVAYAALAPSALRAEPTSYSWQSPHFTTNGVSIAVDTEADVTIPEDTAKHLVEVTFSESVALSELSLGGHPATPAWNRPWPGRVYEAVFLESAPLGRFRDALRAYLSLKWNLALDVTAPQNVRDALRLLGLRSDPLFSSIIIAR